MVFFLSGALGLYLEIATKKSSQLFSDRIHQRKNLPDGSPLHDAERYDQRHHASPRLHGGMPRSGRIAQVVFIDRISSSESQIVTLSLHQPGN